MEVGTGTGLCERVRRRKLRIYRYRLSKRDENQDVERRVYLARRSRDSRRTEPSITILFSVKPLPSPVSVRYVILAACPAPLGSNRTKLEDVTTRDAAL